MKPEVYIADRIFTGEHWLTNHAVVVTDGKIEDVLPLAALSSSQHSTQFDNCIIAPAFIDLQIYGADGKLFAAYPNEDALLKLAACCEKGGAAYCQPTVATNSYEVFYACIDAVRTYWSNGGKSVIGLHLEGPWINPEKRGAHIEKFIHSPTSQQVKDLLAYGKGVITMITLAPEVCRKEILDLILANGIIISAGHSNATYDQARESFANGISTVTHLYNAMSPLQHRSPGLVGATLDDNKIMASIIPDGHHVDYAAIRIAKKIMKERLFVITDAVTETDQGFYLHKKAGDKYEAAGILSGSALSMGKALQNLVNFVGIELAEALRMCSVYPARVMGMEKKMGKIKPGMPARMVVLDPSLEVLQML